jgi:hypothetical protein
VSCEGNNHHFSEHRDGETCDCGAFYLFRSTNDSPEPIDEQDEAPPISLRSIPQGKESYSVRSTYRRRFENAYKSEVKVVPWQEKPPETPNIRPLSEILDHMPYVESEEARERTERRRALNRDEFALLNWFFYSGGTADELRRRVNGEDIEVHPDPP